MKINDDVYSKKRERTSEKKKTNFDFSISVFKRFSDKQKEDFYREFSTLIKSGIDFNQALEILIEQQKSKFVKSIYEKITEDVVKGKSLYQAIKEHKHFSLYEYYSIKIGEDK